MSGAAASSFPGRNMAQGSVGFGCHNGVVTLNATSEGID